MLLRLLVVSALVAMTARLPAQELHSVADCERYAAAVLDEAIRGDRRQAFAAMAKDHAALPIDFEGVRKLVDATRAQDALDHAAYGETLAEVEPWGSRQVSPTSLFVMAGERRMHGQTPWVIEFSRHADRWRVAGVSNQDAARELASRFSTFIAPDGRITSPPSVDIAPLQSPDRPLPGEELATPRDCEAAVLKALESLASGRTLAGLQSLYERHALVPHARAGLEQKAAAIDESIRQAAPGNRLAELPPYCLGHCRMGDRRLIVIGDVPRLGSHLYWMFEFQRTATGWKIFAVTPGGQATQIAMLLARVHTVSFQESTWPPTGNPGPPRVHPVPSAAEQELTALARKTAEKLAHGELAGPLTQILEASQAAGLSTADAVDERLQSFSRDARMARMQFGDLVGTFNAMGRINWGPDYFQETFLVEREEGGRMWTFAFYRANEHWAPLRIESGQAAEPLLAAACRCFPAWETRKDAAPLYDARFKFAALKTPPAALQSERDCLAAGEHLLRDLVHGDPVQVFPAFMRKHASHADSQQIDTITAAVARAIPLEVARGGAFLDAPPQCIGSVLRGPSEIATLFLLKQERSLMPAALVYYRGQHRWEFLAIELSDPAIRRCLWGAALASE